MTEPLRRAIRAIRGAWRRARFRAWAARLAIQMRRNGGRLVLDAPHGAWLQGLPRIRAMLQGEGEGVFELEIGRDVQIEPGLVLEVWARGTNRLVLGDGVVIRDGARIELRSGTIELGRMTEQRSLALLKSYGRLAVGDEVVLSRGVFVQCQERVEIGDHCGIGEWVSVIDSDHTHDGSDSPVLQQPLRVQPVAIGPNTLVARGTVVLRGAEIGENSFVGANSVVTRGEYPPRSLLAGSPASVRRELSGER